MHKLVIFDIDQTLISINCGNLPQRQALNIAFEQVHGVPDAFEDVTFAGGMDLPLMVEVYRRWGFNANVLQGLSDMSRFNAAYFDSLARKLATWTKGVICPGVPDLLETLASNPNVQLGLETGNFKEAAFIKLRKYGLDRYFEAGGFGGEHTQRHQLVASAIADCQKLSGRVFASENVFVIGDSPSDIEAGKANSVRTLAVATGLYSVEDLAKFNPDHVLPDLSDTGTVLRLLLGT